MDVHSHYETFLNIEYSYDLTRLLSTNFKKFFLTSTNMLKAYWIDSKNYFAKTRMTISIRSETKKVEGQTDNVSYRDVFMNKYEKDHKTF